MNDRRHPTRARYGSIAGLLCLLLMPCWSGCTSLLTLPVPENPQAFLRAAETAPDSVALEIFQVRYPAVDQKLNKEVWQLVDEQRLDVNVRHELIRNGFRAGVLGGVVPDRLAKYLNLESEKPETKAARVITGQNADPSVTRRVVQLGRSKSVTVVAAELRDQLNILINNESGLRGRSFEQVQAVYLLRAQAVAGQRVTLRLTPELQHGEQRLRYSGSDQAMGIFMATPSRERELYDDLELHVEMTAGEFLIVGGLPDASGSLGHAFHAENQRGPAEQKLILIRLVEVPGSEILSDVDY